MKSNLRERSTRYRCVIRPKVHFVPGLVQLGHLSSFFKHALEKHDWCVSILKQI